MIKSRLLRGAQISEDGIPTLVIKAFQPDTPEEELELDLMHRPEAIGTQNVAYLVFGVPGTATYAFYDLNNLPADVKVCVILERSGTLVSKSEFSGTTGNQPQG